MGGGNDLKITSMRLETKWQHQSHRDNIHGAMRNIHFVDGISVEVKKGFQRELQFSLSSTCQHNHTQI